MQREESFSRCILMYHGKEEQMKRYIINLTLVITLLIGIALLLYPSISEYVNSKTQSQVIESYAQQIDNMTSEETEKVLEAARQYNEKLSATAGAFYNPALLDGYYKLLNVSGNGVIGYIGINKIKLELPIYHSVAEQVLQIATGHLEGSSLPIGGASTHAVISGHRGLPSAKLFTDLDKLDLGDTFYISVLNQLITYQVDQIKTVKPTEVQDLQILPGKDYCTLFTCTPYGINTHRLLIRGKRIENDKKQSLTYVPNEAFEISPFIVTPIVAAPMLLILLVLLLVSGAKANRKKNKSNGTC